MKTTFIAVAVSGLLCVLPARADDNKMIVKRDRVSLFKVPLKCPAAPEIGCGSAAKPILLALERDSRIKEAWLDNTGMKLAVVGPENSTRDARFEAVKSVLAPDQTKPQELEGEEREAAFEQFQSAKGWYRAAGVDQLSRQESSIIAARLIGRLRAKVPLSDENAKRLKAGFAEIFERCFTREPMPLDQRNEELLKLARQHLDEKGIEVLKESLASGIRPLPNEK